MLPLIFIFILLANLLAITYCMLSANYERLRTLTFKELISRDKSRKRVYLTNNMIDFYQSKLKSSRTSSTKERKFEYDVDHPEVFFSAKENSMSCLARCFLELKRMIKGKRAKQKKASPNSQMHDTASEFKSPLLTFSNIEELNVTNRYSLISLPQSEPTNGSSPIVPFSLSKSSPTAASSKTFNFGHFVKESSSVSPNRIQKVQLRELKKNVLESPLFEVHHANSLKSRSKLAVRLEKKRKSLVHDLELASCLEKPQLLEIKLEALQRQHSLMSLSKGKTILKHVSEEDGLIEFS